MKWNNFQQNVTRSFQNLRHEEYYSDVTLMGDDYQPLQAHKVVLSSCSEYFKNVLFNSRNHPNPVLCMEGLTKNELKNVLDYVYNGEVQVKQDDLDSFLTIAKRFKLEGLIGQDTQMDETVEEGEIGEEAVDPKDDFFKVSNLVSNTQIKNEGQENEMIVFQSLNLTEQEVNEKLDELFTLDDTGMFTCNFCSKISKNKGHMREHVEIHVEGLMFPCKLCDKSCKTRATLRWHARKNHL